MEEEKKKKGFSIDKTFKQLKSYFFKDIETSSYIDDNQEIFLREEGLTNKKVIKIMALVCLLGPFLLLGKWLKIFPNMEYESIFILTAMIIGIYAFLFSLTFFSKTLAEKPFLKYLYVFMFNVIVWGFAFCQGLDVRLGYLIVPLVACVYFNPRFLLTTDVLSYFTMVFSICTRFFLRNIPNYISENVPEEFIAKSVTQYTTAKEWILDSLVRMSVEYFIFILIQIALVRKAVRVVYSNRVKNKNIKNLQRGLLKGMATLVEFKEPTTGYHLQKVSSYVTVICEELVAQGKYTDFLDDNMIHILEEASKIHDLGKIAVPDTILRKNTILTAQEFAVIKQHPLAGAQIIEKYIRPYYEDKQYIDVAKDIALYHHEWWNGNGYPCGLKGTDIPLSARIMAVADVLDSLLSKRPYKQPYNVDKTYEIIFSLSGSQFDPDIILALTNIKDKVDEIAHTDINYVVADIDEVLKVKPKTIE